MADLKKVFGKQDEAAMIQMARDVIDIPSPTGEEGAMADYVAARFRDLGLQVELQEVEPGRNNVIARLRGAGRRPTLLFLAHFDTSTNPEDDLPFGFKPKAVLKDGWLYGLGISNMKCAFVGYWSALQMLRDAGVGLGGDVIVAGVVGEIEKGPIDEYQGRRYRGGGLGARYLLNHGLTADFCINGEPTGMRLQTGNCGYIFAKIAVKGSAQATFSKGAGVDAMERAIGLRTAIIAWEPEYQRRHAHPVMKPLIGVGAIHGGYPYKPSVTPGYCNLYVHINLIPGQSVIGVKREIEELIAREREKDPLLEATVEFFVVSNGHLLEDSHPLPQAVMAAHRDVFDTDPKRPNPERYSVSSDNSPLLEFGIPGITYGAGGMNVSGQYNMYEPNIGEVVSVANLSACARVYAASALRLLGEA